MEEVVIVVAGPAGLAAAAFPRAHGIQATILERAGRIGEPWLGPYDRLHLHTIRWLSHLPRYRIPRELGRWVARDQFVEYLEQYAGHHGLEPRLGVEATSIEPSGAGWRVATRQRAFDARGVVVATGYSRVPYLPPWPGSFAGPIMHACSYRNPERYRGRDVLVVGAGNSGTEIAVDLAEGARPGSGSPCARRRTSSGATPWVCRRSRSGSR